MPVDLIPLVSFVIATTFSPGPNNIACASLGVRHGYRGTLGFIAGICCGFFMILIACAFLSAGLLTLLPGCEKYLRWLGAAYITWLAVSILQSDLTMNRSGQPLQAFSKGFVLQLFNPKAIVYGLTLFSTFLAPVATQMTRLPVWALVFAAVTFTATSTWALGGAAIRTGLQNARVKRTVNLLLFALLIYTAVDLSGILAEPF